MIDPGQMRTRLVYEEEAAAAHDAHGNPVATWGPVCELWARVRPLKGSEEARADRVSGSRQHEVTCRFDPRIRTTGRLRIKGTGRVMQIDSIVDWEERRVELTIAATESVGA